jgi:eukaryotic-like serine/threonine-protein kinase
MRPSCSMPTDRWLTLERLYHSALERPANERAAFLEEACKDETLRREVLALLEQPSMPEFLGGPAIDVAAAIVDEVHVSQWTGRRIGVYQLQTLLGKGGSARRGGIALWRHTALGAGRPDARTAPRRASR